MNSGVIWRRGGRELYYRAANGRTMAVSVSADRDTFRAGVPTAIFGDTDRGVTLFGSPDGQRFLVAETVAEPPPLTVLLNWRSLLR